MRIGDAAASLQMPTHVLRHWEDAGVVVPQRNGGGHRVYDQELILRAYLVRMCQRAGLSLKEIRSLMDASQGDRKQYVEGRREEIARQLAALQRADDFLAHVLQCRHPVLSSCPQCSDFADREERSARGDGTKLGSGSPA